MRGLPHAALLYRQYHAQSASGALLQARDDQRHAGERRRADQDVSPAWRQGLATLPARRAALDVGRYGRVFQPGPRRQTDADGKKRPAAITSGALASILSSNTNQIARV